MSHVTVVCLLSGSGQRNWRKPGEPVAAESERAVHEFLAAGGADPQAPRQIGGSACRCAQCVGAGPGAPMSMPSAVAAASPLASSSIASHIPDLRGQRVMPDSDLTALYDLPTKALAQAVKRNAGRFPGDFMFQLDRKEWAALRSQSVTSKPAPMS